MSSTQLIILVSGDGGNSFLEVSDEMDHDQLSDIATSYNKKKRKETPPLTPLKEKERKKETNPLTPYLILRRRESRSEKRTTLHTPRYTGWLKIIIPIGVSVNLPKNETEKLRKFGTATGVAS